MSVPNRGHNDSVLQLKNYVRKIDAVFKRTFKAVQNRPRLAFSIRIHEHLCGFIRIRISR